jgi:hypothetical protein
MTPIEAAREIQSLLDRVSGVPAISQLDDNVAGFASMSSPTAEKRFHVLRYKPRFESDLPFITAFQCGITLRTYQSLPENRFDVTRTTEMETQIHPLVAGHIKSTGVRLAPPQVAELAGQFGRGLGTQLRSLPVAIRVNDWILREYPALATLQRRNADREIQEAMHGLSPNIRSFAPQRIIDANAAMNCANVKFWAAAGNDPLIEVPFVSAGYSSWWPC